MSNESDRLYAFADEGDTEACLKREIRIRNALTDGMIARAGELYNAVADDASGTSVRDAVVTMLATYIEYAIGRPAGQGDRAAAAARNTAIDMLKGTTS